MEKQQRYYVYYTTTSSFSPKEKKALHDLFGRDFFRKDEDDLSDEQVQRILSRVKPAMKKWLNTSELLPFLERHNVLSDSELQLLKSSTLKQREQAIRLVEFLINKGSYGIAAFYLSLIESSEQEYGIPAHYQLAGELKQTVHAESGFGSEEYPAEDVGVVRSSSIDMATRQSLQVCLKKFRGITLPRPVAESLVGNLGLSPGDIHTLPLSLERICSIWISKESNPYIDDLIQALILTRTTGRYAPLICSTKEKSESPGVRNFFLTLGVQWQLVAGYLGYSRREVDEIVSKFPDSIENQVSEFLELWQLPSTGQLSLPLLHKLKTLSGITTEQSQSRKLADRTDVPSYVYMNKRLKTDAAGIPHRSLDSYQHYSTRSQALRAPYGSFTSYESTTPPTSSPPKPPRSYQSSGNQPRDSYSNSLGSSAYQQQQRENEIHRSQSLSSSNSLPRGSVNYNNTTSPRSGNDSGTSRLTSHSPVEPRRAPPPPPPSRPPPPPSRPSPGYGQLGPSSEPTKTQSPVTGPQFIVMLSFRELGSGEDTGLSTITGNQYTTSNQYTTGSQYTTRPMDHNEDPVIEEISDDLPMELIETRSADGSPPPLSDGTASPVPDVRELNDLDDQANINNLDDQVDINDINDFDDHSETDELNDLGEVTPPSTQASSRVITPNHLDKPSSPLSPPPSTPEHALATSEVLDKNKVALNTVETLPPHEHSTPMSTSNAPESPQLNNSSLSSVKSPLPTKSGSRDTHAANGASPLISPNQPVMPQPSSVMATETAATAKRDLSSGEEGIEQTNEAKNNEEGVAPSEIPPNEKPRSLDEDNNNVVKKRPVLLVTSAMPDRPVERPERQYHSRARLDSLEDRNNLDTDSELESFSESEKESDTEDYPGAPSSNQRKKRLSQREVSPSIPSSDEEDPFADEGNDFNDLSVMSSPEHELPPGGGGSSLAFGVSLSSDVSPGKFENQPTRPVTTNNLKSLGSLPDVLPPQAVGKTTGKNQSGSMSQYGGKVHLHEESTISGASGAEGLNDLCHYEDKRKTDVLPSSERTISGQPEPLVSGRPEMIHSGRPEALQSGQDSMSEPPIDSEFLSNLGDSPLPHQSMSLTHHEDSELARREPTHQVTRHASDQVIEPASYSTSSSDQLQPPVRKSFSSVPATHSVSGIDDDHLLRPTDLDMPVSLSAPSTGLQMLLDQPPPPFTHYAAPPPIFTAHVLEQNSDPSFSTSTVDESYVRTGDVNESRSENADEEWSHSGTGMGMERSPAHRSIDDRSTGSHSLLVNSLDNPPTEGSSIQSTERDHVDKQQAEQPKEFLSQDIVQALEDPDGIEVLSALLESGANINLPTKDGEYAVHIAVRVEKGLEKMRLLLQGNAERNAVRLSDLKTPLHLACLRQDLEMVQLLLEGADVHPCPQDSQGFTPLHFRQTLENVDITRCLIDRRAAVDIPCKNGFLTPLLVCCVVGHSTYDSACLLVQSDANINGAAQASNKPLIAASAAGYEAMVKLLLDKNADINVTDLELCTPLLRACQNKHVSVAKRLCQSNYVDVNAPNKDGVTPLMAAAVNNLRDLVIILLQNGAYHDVLRVVQVTVPGGEVIEVGVTPLAEAAIRGFLEVIQTLVDYGAEINAINAEALPPITGAILAGQAGVVEYFTKQNDLDVTLEGLMQPFIMAVKCGNQFCAELVIERYPGGIDMMLRSASDQGLQELVQCIETFQQASLESSPEEPQVFLLPNQLPWDTKPHPSADQGTESPHVADNPEAPSQPSLNDLTLGEARQHQQEQRDTKNLTNESRDRQSPVPSDLASVDRSSVQSHGSASLSGSSRATESAAGSVASAAKANLPQEVSSRPQGVTDRQRVRGEENQVWNRFEDEDCESGDESASVGIKVMHVDDPRLGFGQSVYVGRQDHSSSSSGGGVASQLQPSALSVLKDVGDRGQSSSADREGGQMQQSSTNRMPQRDSTSASAFRPISSSQELLTPSDLTRPPLVPPNSFATPAVGNPPQSTPETVKPPALINTPYPTAGEQQPPAPQRPLSTVSQSLPTAPMSGAQNLPNWQNNQPSNTPTSSLGFSTSAPPLRARATDDEARMSSELASGTLDEDRLLFAPRPKSPPPPDTTNANAVNSGPVNLQTPSSMTANVVEILHEFAQITISAAVGQKGHEALIDQAMGSGYEHVATFFLNYFHNPAEFARGSNLVSEFIGGSPSPLNYLLMHGLVSKVQFKQVLSEFGSTDFVEQLMMALHQFPGSDNLPWSGEEMLTHLFSLKFSIGSLGPNPVQSQMSLSAIGGATNQATMNEQAANANAMFHAAEQQRSDSPPPPKPFSGPTPQKEHTFPETGGHVLGRGTTDVAKVNNPRNIVTPIASHPPKVTPTATPTPGSTPGVTPPRRLSAGSVASSASSFSNLRPQQQDAESGSESRKQKLGVSSLSSSRAGSRESLNSTVSSGTQSRPGVPTSRTRWGNEVEEPNIGEAGQQSQASGSVRQFDNEVEGRDRKILGATPSLGKPRFGNEVESSRIKQLPPTIQLENVGEINELNDIDHPGQPEDHVQLPLSLTANSAPSNAPTNTVSSHAEKQHKQMDRPSEKMGAALTSSSFEPEQAHSTELDLFDDEEENDLDADDVGCPSGAAFDVIDNVSMSAAKISECPPPTSVSSANPSSEDVHHAETWNDHPHPPPSDPSMSSGLTSTPAFMQSLTVDAQHSKSALPPLKSTYGEAGVGTLELFDEPAPDSTTSAPNPDLMKQMKPDFVQPLSTRTNEMPSKPGHKVDGLEESIQEFGEHEPTSSLDYGQVKPMKLGLAQPPVVPSKSNTTRVQQMGKMPPPFKSSQSSIAQVPHITPGNSIPISGSEHTNALESGFVPLVAPENSDSVTSNTKSTFRHEHKRGEFDEEDKSMSMHYDSTKKDSKIQPKGGVPLSSTSSNRYVTLANMSKMSGKDQGGLEDEKANTCDTTDFSLVKHQGLSQRFYPKTDSKHFDENPLHATAVKTYRMTGEHVQQLKPDSSEQSMIVPSAAEDEQSVHKPIESHTTLPMHTETEPSLSQGSQSSMSPTESHQSLNSTDSQSHGLSLSQQMPGKLPTQANPRLLHTKSPLSAIPTSRVVPRDGHGKQFSPKPILTVPLRTQTMQEDSDSTDTETDEESRGSFMPLGLKAGRAKKVTLRPVLGIDPTSSVERDEVQRTPSPTENIEVFTGGAWDKKNKGISAVNEQKTTLDSSEVAQQPSKFMSLRESAVLQRTKKVPTVVTTQSRSSSKESLSPPTHRTSSESTGSPATKQKSSSSNIKTKSQGNKGHEEKKKVASLKSPVLTKRVTSTSKLAPTSIPSERRKPAVHKPSAKEPATNTSGGRKQQLLHRSSKSTLVPPPSKQSPRIRHKVQSERKSESPDSKVTELEKSVKAKAGFPITVDKIDKEKLVSTDEEHENVHVKEKPVYDSATYSVTHLESRNSSTTVSSVSSLMFSGTEQHMLVSLQDIANHSEQIFGIQIPNVVISGDEEDEMFKTIAERIRKWKMLGRYLSLKDEVLEEIELHNHFDEERCLKMLKRFIIDVGDGATYVRLAIALKNIMHDSLVADIAQYFPQYHQASGSSSAANSECVFPLILPSKIDGIDASLSVIKESFKIQKNNGKQKAKLEVRYPSELANTRANSPLCFELSILNAGSIRVLEDVCVAAIHRRVKELTVNILYV